MTLHYLTLPNVTLRDLTRPYFTLRDGPYVTLRVHTLPDVTLPYATLHYLSQQHQVTLLVQCKETFRTCLTQ